MDSSPCQVCRGLTPGLFCYEAVSISIIDHREIHKEELPGQATIRLVKKLLANRAALSAQAGDYCAIYRNRVVFMQLIIPRLYQHTFPHFLLKQGIIV